MYFKIVDALALHYKTTGDYVSGLPYCNLCCQILEYNNNKNSKEYYDALNRLFNCAYEAGDYPVMNTIAPELKSMIYEGRWEVDFWNL